MTRDNQNQLDDALRAELIARAWELRLTGMTERKIAVELNVSQSTVHNYLKTAQQERLEESTATANEYRIQEVERLDSLQNTLLNELLTSLTEDDPKSVAVKTTIIDKCIKITQERSKLLGLYAPVEIKEQVSISVQEELNKALDKIEAALPHDIYQRVLDVLSTE